MISKFFYKGIWVIAISFLLLNVVLAAQSYQYISPVPASKLNSRATNIILRPGAIIDESSLNVSLISVAGDRSGNHDGRILLADDGRTVVFVPFEKFAAAEQVSVHFKAGLKTQSGQSVPTVSFSFMITPLEQPIPAQSEFDYQPESLKKVQPKLAVGDTLPADFPTISVVNHGGTAPGVLFGGVKSTLDSIGSYHIVLDDSGKVVFYEPGDGRNFRVQPNGFISYAKNIGGRHDNIFMIEDHNFTVVDSFQMGNGYLADGHDFWYLPNGHALMLAYDVQPIDMSQLVEGGQPDAKVTGSIIQELDNDKNVIFQWRSWDYIPITDSYNDLTKSNFDYIHINAMYLDNDGNILLSCRGTSDIVKISRNTGEIIWRLGGKHNDFVFINEHPENAPRYFKYQHHIRRLPNGHITLFDNGINRSDKERGYSRAVEYELDEMNKTATLVWEYRHSPDIAAISGGKVQRLSNGNTLITWGGATRDGSPVSTEVNNSGDLLFEVSFSQKSITGTFLRYAWDLPDISDEVTQYELLAGNSYTFNEGDSVNTGTTLLINSFEGDYYNTVTVTKTKQGPQYPQFTEKAPRVLPVRVTVSQESITSIDAAISFDTKVLGIDTPDSVLIYQREFPGQGLFLPLATSYNSVTGKVSANMTKFGEFIVGYPDYESVVYAPKLLQPADSSTVNETLPLTFSWAPVGFFHSLQLQVATDAQFSQLVADQSSLKGTEYTLDSLSANTTYYWRMRATNDAGTSEWSKTFAFSSIAPLVHVSAPNGGEKYQRGLEYFIRWEDNISEKVAIDLYRSDTLFQQIATVASSGVYRWSVDAEMPVDSTYKIRLSSTNDSTLFDVSDGVFTVFDTLTAISTGSEFTVSAFQLQQNYPNPFNPATAISYQLATISKVRLTVYNTLGQVVSVLVNQTQQPGAYTVRFDGRGLASGIYLYRIETSSGFMQTKKMILIR